MRLSFKCETYEFQRFKNGNYAAMLIVGTRKLYEHAYKVDLGDIVSVSNCVSNESLSYRVSQISKYMGASTPESAMNDLKSRLGLAESAALEDSPIYFARDSNPERVPFLPEGIYALIIERCTNRARGDKNRRKKP